MFAVGSFAFKVLLSAMLRTYCVSSFYMPSGSMENTLHRGDLLLGDKFSYTVLQENPQRGEIAVFRYPGDPQLMYLKRVVGLPGDEVEVRDGAVYVNGEKFNMPLKEAPFSTFGPETVPENEYFVLGDNINHSSDSRVWGYVPREHFIAKLLFVFYSPSAQQRAE